MPSKWHEKKARIADQQFERDLQNRPDDTTTSMDIRDAAMGGGEDAIFVKKLSKEEKKARAKAAREAKKKEKKNKDSNNDDDNEGEVDGEQQTSSSEVATAAAAAAAAAGGGGTSSTSTKMSDDDGIDHDATDRLASMGTIVTYASNRKGVDARSRDINVTAVTVQHMGHVLLDETEIILNHGNRYGLIGRNGCGKSTLLAALGARSIPIPRSIDIFFLKEEVEPSNTMTALDAVMSVDEERLRLEQQAEELNQLLAKLNDAEQNAGGAGAGNNHDDVVNNNNNVDDNDKTLEEQQEEVMDVLNSVYERLDSLDASTAEVRARTILKGLGFTHEMQSKLTKDFSGGWRMRVSLARALFIQPVCLLLDEPTNHLDMEAVIWLEDYLSKWNRILLLISHSQDFLNNVCTHMIHFTNRTRKLEYYDGNYDQYIKTKSEKEENQLKQYKWEQEQIKSMKNYIARFGHGTSKNAKQAQSKEKVLAKMIRSGLTEKPEEEKPLNFKFTDPGHLPPPVLAFHNVSFAYPSCQPLYTNVNFGVDLDSRVALVGPNGAGKTTLVKLMAGELQPSLGDIRPHGHLKLGRFTQHFIDVLDLEQTPLEFFETKYPSDPREEQRKYLGRFGISGTMQVQKMNVLSDGQKSRVVFAKLGRDVPHILLLDEPTNHLDMESIDALAKAINEFHGGMVLVSHDMRLISQVAKEIWICDHKTITQYKGDIQDFKMNMREQILGDTNKGSSSSSSSANGGGAGGALRGDASVLDKKITKKNKATQQQQQRDRTEDVLDVIVSKKKSSNNDNDDAAAIDPTTPSLTDEPTPTPAPVPAADVTMIEEKKVGNDGDNGEEDNDDNNGNENDVDDDANDDVDDWEKEEEEEEKTTPPPTTAVVAVAPKSAGADGGGKPRYVPPHLRKKMREQQQQQQQQH